MKAHEGTLDNLPDAAAAAASLPAADLLGGSDWQQVATAVDNMPLGIVLAARDGSQLTHANAAARRMLGLAPSAALHPRSWQLLHREGEALAEAGMPLTRAALLGESLRDEKLQVIGADGQRRWLNCHAQPLRDSDGELSGGLMLMQDITDQRMLWLKFRLAASFFQLSREAITITDANNRIVDVNEAFCRITGYRREEVMGQNPKLLASGHHGPAFYAEMWAALEKDSFWSGEIWNRRKNGEVYIEHLSLTRLQPGGPETRHHVAMFQDITQLKRHEELLLHAAHHDPLTGLPNRVLLGDRLQQAVAGARRSGHGLALALLDLDGFSALNEQHGPAVCDALLVALADRLKLAVRDCDTVARLGGDEFVALLCELSDADSPLSLVQRLRDAVGAPTVLRGQALSLQASIGISLYPQAQPVEADQMLRQADSAMQQAKLAGRNGFHVFNVEQDRALRQLNDDQARIRLALQQDELRLHYQPKVHLRLGQLVGAEALIRWQHPEQGLLGPARFLPQVARHRLDLDIGHWVIATALRQVQAWRAAGLSLPVSVNVSAYQLLQPDFVAELQALLAQHPEVPPAMLELEVLESEQLDDMDRAREAIAACSHLGVRVALDDFGTGYSSLTHLRRLAVAAIKIDQSFVRNMQQDPDDLAILVGVIGLAAAFGRQVVAEGVETEAHGEALLRLGCEWAQGYAIARPMPGAELPAWAAAWKPPARWAQARPLPGPAQALLFGEAELRAWKAWLLGERGAAQTAGEAAPGVQAPAAQRFGPWLHSPQALAVLPDAAQLQALRQLHTAVVDLGQAWRSACGEARAPRLQAFDAAYEQLMHSLEQAVQEAG